MKGDRRPFYIIGLTLLGFLIYLCTDDQFHGRMLKKDPISFFPFPDLGGFAFSEEAACPWLCDNPFNVRRSGFPLLGFWGLALWHSIVLSCGRG